MTISYKAIGRNIKKARQRCGLTQETIAGVIGISTLHWGRIERGERRVSLDQLARISDALNTPLEQILWGAFPSLFSPPASSGLGTIIDHLSAGCSEKTLDLMLDLCLAAAIHDKYANT